ncbi:F-box protein SKIP31 [Trifolium pratense]|uniref:F-box protein SKIP31 n=1 Tax=Trifolium pratense TaxID=57577 RepID=A0A2K3MV94_TRIPR|nr:F-box protein SKIP31 [Trifolium pratense]PNX94751.1 F-box protein SKIP31 [Trifolium pratense]
MCGPYLHFRLFLSKSNTSSGCPCCVTLRFVHHDSPFVTFNGSDRPEQIQPLISLWTESSSSSSSTLFPFRPDSTTVFKFRSPVHSLINPPSQNFYDTMTFSDDEDENLAQFLESEVLSEVSDKEEENVEEPKAKRKRVEEAESNNQGTKQCSGSSSELKNFAVCNPGVPRRIESGFFSKVPPELYHHILKFLSSEVNSLPWFCDFLCPCLDLVLQVLD